MNALLDAALRLQQFCQEQRWQFCWIGGLAVQRWGEPRFTQDADMTLLTGFGHEATYVDRYKKIPRRLAILFPARALFGFTAQTPFADGLRRTVHWYLQQNMV